MDNYSDDLNFDNLNGKIIDYLKKYKFIILIGILAVIVLIGAWHYTNRHHAMESAKKTLNEKNIYYNEYEWLICEPPQKSKQGFIIYPGGNVEPEAYLPLADKISKLGFKTIIVPMPFNLAVFNADAAIEVFYEYSDIKQWYIAGHSLGGAMAARFADLHTYKIEGLIMMAAYPEEVNNLSQTELPVISITASNDKILDKEKFRNRKDLLPDNTKFVEIKGGNHSQFGWYGYQKGDGQATISHKEQLQQTVKHIKNFIEQTN